MSLVSLSGLRTKTPSVQTLGVLFFGLLCSFDFDAAFADCVPRGVGEPAIIDRVLDGDTVKLKDGRHVRVLGINTPEIEHGEKAGQALGTAASDAAEKFFSRGKNVRLFYDVQRVDPYGRTLAHIYDPRDRSLSAHLLREGLGFHVAIPPNLSLNECLHAQEAIARNKLVGVWNDKHWKPVHASLIGENDLGFKRVTGRVVDIYKTRSVWLELDGPITIKISSTDLKNFPARDWQSWKGKKIEARGWVTTQTANKAAGKKRKSDSPTKQSNKYLVMQPRIAGNLELLEK
ncbi:MAG: nuclease [Gammaproteobacteria bacterium]|nr:MAG: nuclease [Gammaproteobacteria bacterium]